MDTTVLRTLRRLLEFFLKNRILTPRKAFTTCVVGPAALTSWGRYILQIGRQIKQILRKDTKHGIFIFCDVEEPFLEKKTHQIFEG